MARPCIAMTPGEPAGIGPDLCLRLLQQTGSAFHVDADIILIADPELLHERGQQLHLDVALPLYDPAVPVPWSVLPVTLKTPAQAGHLNIANAAYVLETLARATQGCLSGEFDALVTGPVHKGVINDAGIPFSGHTEYLAQLAGCSDVVMMLATEGLRVALVTTHLPLAQVSAQITRDRLRRTLEILHRDMVQRFGISEPAIGVCGLNPHAGEGGHLGREEIEVIEPVLHDLRQRGWHLFGPLPADTAFTPDRLQQLDVVLAMYHDQGLPVLKHLGFGKAVNITLGLPFIRTSVDHGTALELAGSGNISDSSLRYALAVATDMIGASLPRP